MAAHGQATQVGCVGSRDVDGQTTGHGAENHPSCAHPASAQAQLRLDAGTRAAGAQGGTVTGGFPGSLGKS